jgi:basic membrane protein A
MRSSSGTFRRRPWAAGLAAFLLVLAACSSGGGTSSPTGSGGTGSKGAVGFLYVGPKNDFGYNQAAYEGSLAVGKAFPDLKIIQAENVPETEVASSQMEQMIASGAKIIFPTSFGHLDPALVVAERHPDVTFFHQGGLKTAPNLGTYFGTIWQAEYLAGIVAGKMTKTNKLGFIVSIPISQVLLNVNAFTRGAQSVNPAVTTTVVFTNEWCNKGKQADAANSLIDQGVDVLTQHQDCTSTIIQTAEARKIYTVGYHADASTFAPTGWLTAPVWNWGPLYVDMVKTALDGKFKGSKYDGKYRAGLKEGVVELAPFGKAVPAEVQTAVETAKKGIIDGTLNPFTGPVKDQSGKVRIPEGTSPDVITLESTDYLIQGVQGSIPKG